jgi:hypothetical protein
MHHSQKRSDFVCGLSTRNTVTPAFSIQCRNTLSSSSQSASQSSLSKSMG